MLPREITEQNEHLILCGYAAFSDATAGRARPEPPCDLRTEYCRDRDRIIHCKAFRRLKQKTQVFLAPEGDHYRTRMTHTLEVSQIARTIARGLRLNEDLTEAIALGHDLGHTPFGHAGERALNGLVDGGFTHYEQSVRIATYIEKDGRGLNLTAETLDGIRCHTRGPEASTLEGRIVKLSDMIAYLNHDFEDATVSAGLPLTLPEKVTRVLGDSKSRRITALVTALVESGPEKLSYPAEVRDALDEFLAYMNENLYISSVAKKEEYKVKDLIGAMFDYYTADAARLPDFYRIDAEQYGVQRAAADFISGMTDAYAVTEFENLFVPRSWHMDEDRR